MATNADGGTAVLYAAGHLVGGTGTATFAGYLAEGDSECWVGDDMTLEDALAATVALVVRDHGPGRADILDDQIRTFDACNTVCVDVQTLVHAGSQPLDFPATGRRPEPRRKQGGHPRRTGQPSRVSPGGGGFRSGREPAGGGQRLSCMNMTRVAGLVGLALAPLLGVACSNRPDSASAPTPSGQPPVVSAPTSPSSTPTTSNATAARRTDLADGRHAVHITRVDPAARRISVDVIEIFFGADAARAAKEDKAEEIPPPNDVWIRNANPRLRTLAVAPDAPITVNVHGAVESGSSTKDITKTLPELAGLDRLDDGVFWLTITGGRVTRIAEQYLP